MIPATRVRGRRRPAAAPSRVAAAAWPARARTAGLVVLGLALASGCTTTSGPGGADATPDSRATSTGAPAPTGSAPSEDVGTGDPQAYAEALFAGTNRVRAEEGLQALTWSSCAAEVATGRAEDLVGREGLEHAPMDPVLQACAPVTRAAENLSRATVTAGDVVEAWMGSPGHRANLLSAEVTELGVGCVPDGEPLVCSQIFLGP